jgi:hypothetical protein
MATLHPGLRTRLRTWLDSLPIQRGRSRFGDRYNQEFDAFRTMLSQTQPWRDLMSTHEPLHLTGRLETFQERIPEAFEGRLRDVPVRGLVEQIDNHFVAFLESLPRTYDVFIQLPRFGEYGVPRKELVQGVSLVQTVGGCDPNLMLPEGVEPTRSVLIDSPSRLVRNSTYLCIETSGLATPTPRNYSVEGAIGRLKHFLFMALAENGLRRRGLADIIYFIEYGKTEEIHAVVRDRQDPETESFKLHLPDELNEFLRWVRVDEQGLEVWDEKGKSLMSFKPAETGEEKVRAFSAKLHLTQRFMELESTYPDAERIRAAMEWWVDSESSDNHTVSFLQACIGLEALLGDADERSRVKDRLSDRYSYLLGATQSDRQRLKERFVKMYDHRSTLVHGRRARLGNEDLTAMVDSQQMLSDSIRHEVSNLLRDISRKAEAARKQAN